MTSLLRKKFVNDVVSATILATCWHEVPLPPLEGEVPNEREAEGFVRKLSKKTPQSARSGCQLPFQGRPWQNQNPPPFNAQLNFPTLRADAIRPYREGAFYFTLCFKK